MEPTSDSSPKREEVFKKLSPKQRAMFSFLENVSILEKNTATDDVKAKAKWSKGSTEDLLKRALEFQDPSYLPMPTSAPYEAFGLTMKYEAKDEDSKLTPKELFEKMRQFPEKGSFDMRIYDNNETLQFVSNAGGLESMKDEWASLLDNIPYPMLVRDRNGFSYSNPALQAKSK